MHFTSDFNEHLREHQEKQREILRQNQMQEEADTYARLIELDPDGAEAWFDDDENVPAWGPRVERINIMKARISELEAKRAKDSE